MRLTDLKMEVLNIPFKVRFHHASAIRSSTEAILVRATTDSGLQGIGEGCPRHYVTGETLTSVQNFFQQYRSYFLSIDSVESLQEWTRNNEYAINSNPAAFCAVELALLNTLAKDMGKTSEALLSLPELSGEFFYTAILGTANRDSFAAQVQRYVDMGFVDFKVKVFGDLAIDRQNIQLLLSQGLANPRIRLDANNLWDTAEEAINYLRQLECPLYALEEPLNMNSRGRGYDDHCFDEHRAIVDALEAPIILDENFKTAMDFAPIRMDPAYWIINVRISKMGGIQRSLDVATKAQQLGIPIIVGAQVGETSILSRAALTVANTFSGNVLAQEGAFGTYLLTRDVVTPPLMFGEGGKLTLS